MVANFDNSTSLFNSLLFKKAVLVNSIAGQWTKSDPSEAAKFADTLPIGELKSNAVREVASYWVRQDSIGASVWLGAMDDGEATDRGIVQMASYIAESDAKGAIQCSASISNPITREKYIRINATEWINRGGKLAESQIQSLGLLPSGLKLLNR